MLRTSYSNFTLCGFVTRKIKLKFWKLAFPVFFGLAIIIVHSSFKNETLPVLVSEVINTRDISMKKTPTFIQPIKKEDLGKVTSGYGMRMHPIHKKEMMHNGVDYSAEKGVEIHATLGGVVREAAMNGNYGNMIIIDHEDGFSSRYAQMETVNAKAGEQVSSGQVIGTVGSSGMSTAPHLHFEIMKDGKNVNPEDYLEPFQ